MAELVYCDVICDKYWEMDDEIACKMVGSGIAVYY